MTGPFKTIHLVIIAAISGAACVFLALAILRPPNAPPEVVVKTHVMPLAEEEVQYTIDQIRNERDLANMRADLMEAQSSWFEILISVLLGGFSLLITAVVIFFTIRFGRAAVAEAKDSISKEIDEIRGLLEQAKGAVGEIEDHRASAAELMEGVSPLETPQDEAKRRSLRELAEEAETKSYLERGVDDYRALIVAAFMDEDWRLMDKYSSALAYLPADDVQAEVLGFALVSKAVALKMQGLTDAQIVTLDEAISKLGENAANSDVMMLAYREKARALSELGKNKEAIILLKDAINNVSRKKYKGDVSQLIGIKLDIAEYYGNIDDAENSIRTLEEIYEENRDESASQKECAARALLNRAIISHETNDISTAKLLLEQLTKEFGAEGNDDIQDSVIRGQLELSRILEEEGDLDGSEELIGDARDQLRNVNINSDEGVLTALFYAVAAADFFVRNQKISEAARVVGEFAIDPDDFSESEVEPKIGLLQKQLYFQSVNIINERGHLEPLIEKVDKLFDWFEAQPSRIRDGEGVVFLTSSFLASKYIEDGKYRKAEKVFKRIEALFRIADVIPQPVNHLALLNGMAVAQFRDGEKDTSAETFEQGMMIVSKIEPPFSPEGVVSSFLFNYACGAADSGDVPRAIEALKRLAEITDGLDCVAIEKDSDFDRIRLDPEFNEFLEDMGCCGRCSEIGDTQLP